MENRNCFPDSTHNVVGSEEESMRYFIALFIFLSACTSYPMIKAPEFSVDGKAINIEAQDVQNAKALEWGGKYYILYNEDYMTQYPEDVQSFVFYHELGHIQLGHTDRDWNYTTMDSLQRDADCYALIFVDTPNVREYIRSIRHIEDVDAYCYGR